ncbi:hypothetical protein C6357_28660 [Bacillus wiedmannii]|uniref:Uncharacterized protein n=1 Tax=Bacillus wiedmannii TaxID=1890302 RepID=A0ABX5DNA6_9BACI|nr:hypothetical protein C6357_28660 [Bacillus wiedmannii]
MAKKVPFVNDSQTIMMKLEDLGMEKIENGTVVDKLGDALMDVINSAEKGDSVSFDILSEIKKAIGSN